MGNLSGVVAVLAVLFRPSLVVPHVQVPDIRHLDWEALHANGVRFLVFDKDNCLTAPHSDVLEPTITDAWERCQRVFGRENILIVSNSSGSSDDPSGLAPNRSAALSTFQFFAISRRSLHQAVRSMHSNTLLLCRTTAKRQ